MSRIGVHSGCKVLGYYRHIISCAETRPVVSQLCKTRPEQKRTEFVRTRYLDDCYRNDACCQDIVPIYGLD